MCLVTSSHEEHLIQTNAPLNLTYFVRINAFTMSAVDTMAVNM
jgi:hypothetical protein